MSRPFLDNSEEKCFKSSCGVFVLVANKQSRFLLEPDRGVICEYVGKGLTTHLTFCRRPCFYSLKSKATVVSLQALENI